MTIATHPPLPDAPAVPAAFVADLPDMGLLAFDGPDAEAFLHGQLSSDVKVLRNGGAHWSSYNSPKGRMLGTLLLWREGDDAFRATVSADLAASLARRLAMFVLRAKVRVADLSSAGGRIGVGGAEARAAVAAAFGVAPAPGQALSTAGSSIVGLPDGRLLVCAPASTIAEVRTALAAAAPGVPGERWHALGIAAGIARVTLATQDAFVPQQANWDLVGGVNFQKGCYPGQEIVARMQYLGRLKERLQRFSVAAPPPVPGTALYGDAFAGQVCGTVVEAVAIPAGGSDLLAVVQLAALDGPELHLGTPDGPALTRGELPYAIPAPAVPNRPKLI